MQTFERALKTTVKRAAGLVGKRCLFSGFIGRNTDIILMYHRVVKSLPYGFYEAGMYVTADSFEMHLSEAAEVFEVVPLERLLKDRTRERGCCAITFDDAWADTYENAFPILRKHKWPATIFVPVELIGKEDCFWFENISYLANAAAERGNEALFVSFFDEVVPEWKGRSLCGDDLCALISTLKAFPPGKMGDIERIAYEKIGVKYQSSRLICGWDEIREMSRHNVTFGAHGMRHWILPLLTRDEKIYEIVTPMEVFQREGVKLLPVFSYPNGDWDKDAVSILKEVGYAGAVTTRLGCVSARSDRHLLNRIGLHETISSTPDLFWFRLLQGIFSGAGPFQKA